MVTAVVSGHGWGLLTMIKRASVTNKGSWQVVELSNPLIVQATRAHSLRVPERSPPPRMYHIDKHLRARMHTHAHQVKNGDMLANRDTQRTSAGPRIRG